MQPICKRLVALIEGNADRLTREWLAEVRQRPETPTYHHFDEEALYKRAHSVYSQLGKWVAATTSKEEIAKVYDALGRERYREGFGLAEVLEALMLTRRRLWLLVLSQGFLDTAIDLHAALDLNARVILFFDRAMYFTARGYERAAAGLSN